MKTAMQELIEELKEYNSILVREGIEPKPSIQMFQHLAEKLLEKEKEQIIEAFEQGIEFGFPTNGSNYFNKTYNQNK